MSESESISGAPSLTEHGNCPSCEGAGEVGQPCADERCARYGYHYIPEAAFEARVGLPDKLLGVAGAAWWAGMQQSRDAAIAEWVRERGEDRDASRALDAARERFDRAQRVYEGLAEVTLAWAQRDAELPRFVYRKDPAYRAQLRTSPTDTEG